MKNLTVDDIMAMGPCYTYTREKVEKLWNGHDALTVVEILRLEIPATDKLWAVLRQEVLGEKLYVAFGYVCADRAVAQHAVRCGVPAVEEWAARWLSGEDRTECSARHAALVAEYAASDAARAAEYAASDAARAAAWSARAAAWSALAAAWVAEYAARAAAWSAWSAARGARCAAWTAEHDWQVEKLIEMIGEEK